MVMHVCSRLTEIARTENLLVRFHHEVEDGWEECDSLPVSNGNPCHGKHTPLRVLYRLLFTVLSRLLLGKVFCERRILKMEVCGVVKYDFG